MNLLPGSHRLSANGAVGVSGSPVRVHSMNCFSLTGAATFSLYDGTSASGTKYVNKVLSAAGNDTINFNGGMLFPSGCYLTTDQLSVAAVVIASVEAA